MAIAEFDLPDVTAGIVDLLGYQSCALRASRRFALRDVSSSMDAERLRFGIEIEL
jgi:hypothetical protein